MTGRRGDRWLLIAAIAVTGFSMRTAVTSIGPVLAELQRAFGMSSTVSGVLTTLPVLCFAVLGALTPRAMARVGLRRLLVVSLAAMSVGLIARASVGSLAAFFALSVLALAGGAVANVVLPVLVKQEFPHRIGPLTAVYTAMLALGMTAGAGLTVPVGSLLPGAAWRGGLAFWAIFSIVAMVPWLGMLRHDARHAGGGMSMWTLARSRTAWLVTLFFALQAFQAYIAIGWFAKLMHSHGVSATTSGAMLAVLTAVTIPVYLAAAAIPERWHRPAILVMLTAYLVAYVGLLTAPVGGAWVWMALDGIGGGEFPLALVMIGLRSRDSTITAALSAFVQSVGYLIGAAGPLLFGALEQATGTWTAPLIAVLVATVLDAAFGWFAAHAPAVDDQLTGSQLPNGPRTTRRRSPT